MADKEVRINIKTHAETKAVKDAAASLDKVSEEASQTSQAVRDLEKVTEQLNEELRVNDKLTTEQAGNLRKVADGAGRLAQSQRRVSVEGQGAAKSNSKMGLAALEASRAFEDLQYGIRGVLNNIPQMIMMMGGTAGLSAAISIAAVAGTQLWSRMTSGAKETTDGLDEVAEKMEKVREKAAAANAERGAAETRQWLDSLDAEVEAFQRVNEEIDRNIRLMQAKRRAEAEVGSAQDALDLAKIDADPSMSDSDKIRARAAIAERAEVRSATSKREAVREELGRVEAQYSSAEESAQESAKQIGEIETVIKESKVELQTLNNKIALVSKAMGAIAEIEKDIEKSEKMLNAPAIAGAEYAEARALIQSRIDADRAKAEDIRSGLPSLTGADYARRSTLRTGGRGSIAEAERGLVEKREEAAERAKAAEEARKRVEDARAKAKIEADAIIGAFERSREARGITTDATVRTVEQREADKAAKEQAAAARKAAQARVGGMEDELLTKSKELAGAFVKAREKGQGRVPAELLKTLDAIANSLADGTNASELARIGFKLEQAAGAMGGATIEGLANAVKTMEKMQREIQTLKEKLKYRP